MVFVFLFLICFTLYDNLRSIHIAAKPFFIFFNDWVIFHRIYVPHLLCSYICWWTFRLLPCLGYCKQFCNEHCILSQHVFIQIYAWSRIVGSYSSSIFSFLRTSILFAIVVVSVYIPINSARGSFFPHSVSSIYCL